MFYFVTAGEDPAHGRSLAGEGATSVPTALEVKLTVAVGLTSVGADSNGIIGRNGTLSTLNDVSIYTKITQRNEPERRM